MDISNVADILGQLRNQEQPSSILYVPREKCKYLPTCYNSNELVLYANRKIPRSGIEELRCELDLLIPQGYQLLVNPRHGKAYIPTTDYPYRLQGNWYRRFNDFYVRRSNAKAPYEKGDILASCFLIKSEIINLVKLDVDSIYM